jgi:biotin operon repressor
MKPAVIKPKDLRNFSIVPIRAIKDPRVTATMLKVLVAFCSYADRTGRTFVSLERIGDDIGTSQSAVSKQVTKLKKCGYIVNAKPISRQIKTCTRRILYVNKTEAAIRSSLSSSEVMELSIAEDELKNQALIDSNTPANERPEHEVRVLKARFSVLCDRFFAESMADGWWISTDSQRQTTIQLSNQAVDMLRRDRTAATGPQRG